MTVKLFNDNFQNFKAYNLPRKAQLLIADIPYNIGSNAYASRKDGWIDNDVSKGRKFSRDKTFFDTDVNFNIPESKLLIPEPKQINTAPAMIVFCAYQQLPTVAEYGEKYGFAHSYPLFFVKRNSPQTLKAHQRILGAVETALVLYRDKLPKFNNDGKMILNWFEYPYQEKDVPRIHPTQKSIKVLKRLIEIFTDRGDTVIDPVAGSAVTLRACAELNRDCYGFEINKKFYNDAINKMLINIQPAFF